MERSDQFRRRYCLCIPTVLMILFLNWLGIIQHQARLKVPATESCLMARLYIGALKLTSGRTTFEKLNHQAIAPTQCWLNFKAVVLGIETGIGSEEAMGSRLPSERVKLVVAFNDGYAARRLLSLLGKH